MRVGIGLFATVCGPTLLFHAAFHAVCVGAVNHILSPVADSPGDFKTLNGKSVSISDRVITTGAKFSKTVEAKALVPWHRVKVPESDGDGVWVMVISRPLEGGIYAPAGVEDIHRDDVNRYVCSPVRLWHVVGACVACLFDCFVLTH